MRRRRLLAAVASSVVGLSGCAALQSNDDPANDQSVDAGGDETAPNGTDPSDHEQPGQQLGDGESPAVPEPTGECGPGSRPLSERLTTDAGGDCHEDASPQFRVVNERAEPVTATVSIESDGEAVFRRTFELDAGARVDEENVGVEAARMRTVSVAIDDEGEYSGAWPGRSCRLHGVAVQPGGIEAGYLESVSGHADAMHGCYAGSEWEVILDNEGMEHYDVTVTVVDHCAESTWETTTEAGRFTDTTLEYRLTAGAIYTIAANAHGGGAATYRYEEGCGDAHVNVLEDGDVEIHAVRGTY